MKRLETISSKRLGVKGSIGVNNLSKLKLFVTDKMKGSIVDCEKYSRAKSIMLRGVLFYLNTCGGDTIKYVVITWA